MQGGDTLIIRSGRYVLSVYWDDMITPPSGTEGQWTVIRGEDPAPVLAGRDNLFSAFDISNVSFLKIENLEINSDNGAQFREGISGTGGPCSSIVIDRLHIHHMDEFGIDLSDPENLEIMDCTIEHCGFGSIGGPEAQHGGWRNVRISDCSLSWSGHYYQGVSAPGAGPYDRPDGFGIEPSEGPVEITDCIAEHNRGDGLDSKAANTTIRNCIVANNRCDGVKLWAGGSRVVNSLIYGTGDGDMSDSPWACLVMDDVNHPDAEFEVVNTTIYQDPAKHGYILYCQYGSDVPIRILFRNTIAAGGSGAAYFSPAVSLTADHSLFFRQSGDDPVEADGRLYSSASINGGELGIGNISADPLFMDPASGRTGDYRLSASSPAIDGGVMATDVPDADLDGNPRPLGSGPDIGAYEYQLPVSVAMKDASSSQASIFYDRVSGQIVLGRGLSGIVSVYDLMGKLRMKSFCSGGRMDADLPAGIYIAVLTGGGQKYVARFTVVR
ncbi:right-handed parallel beta-helix repeat-containing protein [bacterium]|nr:right-handed parallel beta-helix repeat-containing protein [bacterium]